MLDRRTATWADRKEAKERFDRLFFEKKIGEPTYIVSLEHLGFRTREAENELRYIKGLK